MNKAKPIPMNEPISFEDWRAGIEERRRTCEEAAPGPARRTEGSDDARLRAAFGGKRAPSSEGLQAPSETVPSPCSDLQGH